MSKTPSPHAHEHRRRRIWPWVTVLVILALVAGAGVAQEEAHLVSDKQLASWARDLGVAPKPAFTVAADPAAPALTSVRSGGGADAEAVRRVLTPLLAAKGFGPDVGVYVGPLAGGDIIQSGPALTPASTFKLLTMTAALESLGGETRFSTSVRLNAGSNPTIVLVGGGDPLLLTAPPPGPVYPAHATLADLATSTATALVAKGIKQVALNYDASMFSGPATGPGWQPTYVSDGVVAPIAALSADEGLDPKGKASVDPPASAAAAFAALLQSRGIAVTATAPGQPAAGATEIASVNSAPLAQLVAHTLTESDNFSAEVIARHVAAKEGGGATFAGVTAGISAILKRLGISMTGVNMLDGSGLSRDDKTPVGVLAAVLRADASHPELSAVLTGMPVAGFSGSLAGRFEKAPSGLGLVRLKTGTLTGVSGIAGVVPDALGTPFVLVVLADQVPAPDTLEARAGLDQIAATLAACTCSTKAAPAGSPTP